MPGSIFISHSVKDKQTADMLIDLFVRGGGMSDTDFFASSLPSHDIPLAQDFRKHLRQEIINAELVILILSANFLQSRFCVSEMGAAWGLGKDIVGFLVPPVGIEDLSGDVIGDIHIEQLNSESTLDKLLEDLQRRFSTTLSLRSWGTRKREFIELLNSSLLSSTFDNGSATLNRGRGVMERGGWTDHIIDGALYIGPDQLQDPRRDVLSLIERGKPVPEVFCYRSDSGFYNWMRLTQDPGYRYYQESLHFFRQSSQSIARGL